MNLFGAIMDKIFHHSAAAPPAPTPAADPAPAAAAPVPDAPPPAAPPPPPAASVDVEAVLTAMAADKDDGGGDWRKSIVDLLKLLDLDSSLTARKQLAEELDVHEGEDGTAEENIALHRAVMQKLEENGGKVPQSLKH